MNKFCFLCYGKGYILEEFESEYSQSKDFYKVPCKKCNTERYLAKCLDIKEMLAKYNN